MKIRPVGPELLFYAKGWTDGHDEANSRFSQVFERAQKKNSSTPTYEGAVLRKKEARGIRNDKRN